MAAPATPLTLIEKIKRSKPRNAYEDLEKYKEYLKHIRRDLLTVTRLSTLKRTLEKGTGGNS